jgi:hypothetical protein
VENEWKNYRPTCSLLCLLRKKQQQREQQRQTHVWVFCAGIRSDQIKLVLSDASISPTHLLTHSFIPSFIQFALVCKNAWATLTTQEGESSMNLCIRSCWEFERLVCVCVVVGIVRMSHWWDTLARTRQIWQQMHGKDTIRIGLMFFWHKKNYFAKGQAEKKKI